MKNRIVTNLTLCLILFLCPLSTFAATCDADGDGKEGIAEAIHALQVASGDTPASSTCTDANGGNGYFEQTRVVENLEDWEVHTYGNTATYTRTGTTSTASVSGNASEYSGIDFEKQFPDAKGIIGTMNLSSINKGASAGFGMYVGMLRGNHIHTNINFSEWDGDIRIRYKLSLRDSNNNTIETLAWGYVPASTLVGQDVKMGFAKIENAVHFYINSDLLFKWQPTEIIGPRERTYVWYWEWVDKDVTSSVSATFKDISIIH